MGSPSLVAALRSADGRFSTQPPAARDLEALVEAFRNVVCAELTEFLAWSDGGELNAGTQVIEFWSANRIILRNERLLVPRRLPDVLLIGSNEGETAVGFATRTGVASFIAVPFGDLTHESLRVVGKTAGEAITRVLSGDLDLDEI